MNVVYNIIIGIVNFVLRIYSKFLSDKSRRKFSLFVKGQQHILKHIATEMSAENADGVPVIWFHAASLGELAAIRPIISKLKEECTCRIVLTFFSPSGYRALADKHPGIDHVFYLPLDTRHNVRAFLDIVHPVKAVFAISEYWPNYLQELKYRAIPTYLVSAIIRDNSPFFRRYGSIYRKALSTYTHFYVLDEHSSFNLSMLGYSNNVTVCGDPLFDNANIIARTQWHDKTIEHFVGGEKVFIAGSIHDENDLQIVSALANQHRDTRFIFVPHDVTPAVISNIKSTIEGTAVTYSEYAITDEPPTAQVLIIDFVGALAYMYRYATWAYVGGGFTPLLHSVIEATIYGLPVAFGPQIYRKVTPTQLIQFGIGQVVTNAEELQQWFAALKHDDERLERIREAARAYVAQNLGATRRIVDTIEKGL